MIEAGAARYEEGQDRSVAAEQRPRIAELERALGRKTYELEVAGSSCGLGGASRGAVCSGGVRDPAVGRRSGPGSWGQPDPGVAGDGGSSPDDVAPVEHRRIGRAAREVDVCSESERAVEPPSAHKGGPEPGGCGSLQRCAGVSSLRGLPSLGLGRGSARGAVLSSRQARRGEAGHGAHRPTGGERGNPSGVASSREGRQGTASADRAGWGRSSRSSPGSGKPAAWRRGAREDPCHPHRRRV
jgi:hypothetical protein